MSCNGCRVLRKGCSDTCILRPCLQWIESPQAQAHATLFVAKFFGRAALMSFISAVPPPQSPALFQSLLYESVGRTVNPVTGAVGLLCTGNWVLCQEAVETVLRGGTPRPVTALLAGLPDHEEASSHFPSHIFGINKEFPAITSTRSSVKALKRRRMPDGEAHKKHLDDLDLSLTTGFQSKAVTPSGDEEKRRLRSPDMISEESVTTDCYGINQLGTHQNLLKLFN